MPKKQQPDTNVPVDAGVQGEQVPADAVPIDIARLRDDAKPSEEEVTKRKAEIVSEKAARRAERRKRRESSRNPFVRLGLAIGRTAHEIGQIVWPSGGTTARMSVLTVVVVVLLAAFIIGMDLGASRLVGWLYSLRP